LLTFSSSGLGEVHLIHLAEAVPEILDQPRGLHFVHLTNTMEPYADKVAAAFEAAERRLPGMDARAGWPLGCARKFATQALQDGAKSLHMRLDLRHSP
jgi:hypothetical protein